MRLDRILLDILDWVRRSLWKKQQGSAKKPYEVIATHVKERGRVKLVSRDTPRSVRTWIFTPFKNRDSPILNLYETHLCCDFLEPLSGERRGWGKYSHQISILVASRKLLPDGGYESEELFEGKYKLHQATGRDFYAIQLMDKLASTLGDRGFIDDYEFEINAIAKQVMAHDYPGVRFQMKRLESVQGIILDKPKPEGFTIVEMLAVLLIIGILSAIAYAYSFNQVQKANTAHALALMRSLSTEIQAYATETGQYPPDRNRAIAPAGLEAQWEAIVRELPYGTLDYENWGDIVQLTWYGANDRRDSPVYSLEVVGDDAVVRIYVRPDE